MEYGQQTRIVRTANRNRNLVLSILARLEKREHYYWPDGLARFGIPTVAGVEPRVNLMGDDWLYSRHRALSANQP